MHGHCVTSRTSAGAQAFWTDVCVAQCCCVLHVNGMLVAKKNILRVCSSSSNVLGRSLPSNDISCPYACWSRACATSEKSDRRVLLS